MPMYGGGGQFGGLFNNPQMGGGQYQRNPVDPYAWSQMNWSQNLFDMFNPGGAQYDPFNTYQLANMQNMMQQGPGYGAQPQGQFTPGYDPNSPFGTNYGPFQNFNLQGPGGTAFSVSAPRGGTGQWNASFDPSALGMGGFDFTPWGGGDTGFTPWGGGDYQAPGPWDIGGSSAAPYSDYSMQAIEANIPYLQRQMDQRMADAGARAGASGFAMSTPYTQSLGEAGRQMNEDLTRIAMDYRTRAASEQAMLEQQAQQNYYDRLYGMGGALAGFQHQGSLADLANQFGAWQTQNMFNQGNLDRNFNAWALQNQLGYNQWALGQGMLQGLFGGGQIPGMPNINMGMNFGGGSP